MKPTWKHVVDAEKRSYEKGTIHGLRLALRLAREERAHLGGPGDLVERLESAIKRRQK